MTLLPGPLRRLAGGLPGSSFARSAGVLASGAAAGQLLIVLASPALTRLYGPAEFGAFAVFSALLFTLLQVACLRYEMAVLLPREVERAASLLALALVVATGFAGAAALGVRLLGDALVAWTSTPGLRRHLWLLPISLWAAGLHQALAQWAVRRRAFTQLARANVLQNLARVVTQLALGALGTGLAGLPVGDATGRWLGAGLLAPRAGRGRAGAFAGVRVPRMLAEARRYRRFPLLAGGAGLLNQAGVQMPSLLLAGLYGPQPAGWYALGQRVINLPMVMIGMAVSDVYAERAATLARGDARGLTKLLGRTALVLACLGAVPFGLLAGFGPQLFATVFGEAWRDTGRYAQALAPMSLAELVAVPISRTLAVLERQGLQLGWDAARLAVVVGVLAFAARSGLSPYLAVVAFGAAMAAAYLVLMLLALAAARRA